MPQTPKLKYNLDAPPLPPRPEKISGPAHEL